MKARTFRAKLQAGGQGGAWVRLQVPFDVEKAFGTRGRVSVIATLNGNAFATSIFPNGDGTHHMQVNKAMQRAAGAGAGDPVTASLRPDDGSAPVVLPPALAGAIARNKAAKAKFDTLSPACRREYAAWVSEAKKEETRAARAAKAVEMIGAGQKRPSAR
jgi:hypothetical protein